MVKLQVKKEFGGEKFYFHTMEDCNAFLCVFSDHFCNVPWDTPIESSTFPEMTKADRTFMDVDPRKRAEGDLAWGFTLVRHHRIEDTPEQKAFVDRLVKQLSGESGC